MGLLQTLQSGADVLSAASPYVSAAKGVLGMFGIGKTDPVKQQQKLMDYQNQINQQNATTAYLRQRQLTQDTPLLNKLGMKNAGISTSNFQTSSAASTNMAASPSGVSTPTSADMDSQYSSMITNSYNSLLDSRIKRAQINLIDEQSENQRQQNLTQYQRDIASLENTLANTKDSSARARIQNTIADTYDQYYKLKFKADYEIAASDAFMKNIDTSMYKEFKDTELANEKQRLANQIDSGRLTRQEIRESLARIRAIDSQIRLNASQVEVNNSTIHRNDVLNSNTDADTQTKKLNNTYLSKTLVDRINQQGYETVISKVNSLPHSYRDIVTRSHQWSVMVDKLENNQPLNQQELHNLDELLKLDTYDPHKNVDHWMNFVSKFK